MPEMYNTENKIEMIGLALNMGNFYFNPMYQAVYNPRMWDVTNARVNLGYSGRSLRRGARIARWFPGGDKLVNKIKDMIGPDNAFVKSSNAWFGMNSTPTAGYNQMGFWKRLFTPERTMTGDIGFFTDAPGSPYMGGTRIKVPTHFDIFGTKTTAGHHFMSASALPETSNPTGQQLINRMDTRRPTLHISKGGVTMGPRGKYVDPGTIIKSLDIDDYTQTTKKFSTIEKGINRGKTIFGYKGKHFSGVSKEYVDIVRKNIGRMETTPIGRVPTQYHSGMDNKMGKWIKGRGRAATGQGAQRLMQKGGFFLKKNLMRGAVALGKGASIVALTALTWEASSMLFEPVGRALGQTMTNTLDKISRQSEVEMGGRLNLAYLSRGAATERQRAVQAISNAHINARSQLGREAMYQHR